MKTPSPGPRSAFSLQPFAFLLLLSTLHAPRSTLFAQGSLTPPGPPAPSMKTLDQLEPRTPITSAPVTISQPGSYYLATNLYLTAGIAITIVTNDVTLDLKGFTLRGAGNGSGVVVSGFSTNITVCNGVIQQWIDGVISSQASNCRFDHLLVSHNNFGIYTGDGTVVADCCVVSNATFGITVGNGSKVLNCISRSNGNYGIQTGSGGNVIGCVAEYNASDGIFVDRGLVKDCVSRQNLGSGITAFINCFVLNNTCLNNGTGTTGAGINAGNGGHRIEGNNVVGNPRGIAANPATGNLIIRNSATGNTTNYDITVPNTAGPIVNSSGIATNNNPHANYSY